MEVKRYDPHYDDIGGISMSEYNTGEYVEYDDYENLQDSLNEAESELRLLKEKITDLWRDYT